MGLRISLKIQAKLKKLQLWGKNTHHLIGHHLFGLIIFFVDRVCAGRGCDGGVPRWQPRANQKDFFSRSSRTTCKKVLYEVIANLQLPRRSDPTFICSVLSVRLSILLSNYNFCPNNFLMFNIPPLFLSQTPYFVLDEEMGGVGQFFFNPTVLRLSSSPACCSCFHQHKKSKYRGRFRICLSVFPKLFPILLVFLFECSTWLCFFEGGGGWTRERKGKRGFNIQQKYIAPYMRALHR